jgi:hypothetical protein
MQCMPRLFQATTVQPVRATCPASRDAPLMAMAPITIAAAIRGR